MEIQHPVIDSRRCRVARPSSTVRKVTRIKGQRRCGLGLSQPLAPHTVMPQKLACTLLRKIFASDTSRGALLYARRAASSLKDPAPGTSPAQDLSNLRRKHLIQANKVVDDQTDAEEASWGSGRVNQQFPWRDNPALNAYAQV